MTKKQGNGVEIMAMAKLLLVSAAMASLASAAASLPQDGGATNRVLNMCLGDFRTAWCNVGDARSRLEPLASSLESLSSMVDELRRREPLRPDGTCHFDFSALKPDKHRDFILNLRSRASNAKAFYFGKFVHDQAAYRRFLEAHPNFLGFESWEWGNDAYLPRSGYPLDEIYRDIPEELRSQYSSMWIKVKLHSAD